MQDKRIGAKIKYVMSVRNINQGAFADVLGIGQSAVSLKLGGRRRFAPKELKLVADYLKTTVDFLYSNELLTDTGPAAAGAQSGIGVRVGLYRMDDDRDLRIDGTGRPNSRPEEMVVTERAADVFAVVVAGESLEPEFFKGDVLFLSGEARIGEGDYAYYETRAGGRGVRRVFYDEREEKYTFKAADRLYADKVFKLRDVTALFRVVERRETF